MNDLERELIIGSIIGSIIVFVMMIMIWIAGTSL